MYIDLHNHYLPAVDDGVKDIEETLTDEQTRVREMIIEKDGYKGIASPIKLSRSKTETRHTPPDFGVDNREVLRQAGYSSAEIEHLAALGAVVERRAG